MPSSVTMPLNFAVCRLSSVPKCLISEKMITGIVPPSPRGKAFSLSNVVLNKSHLGFFYSLGCPDLRAAVLRSNETFSVFCSNRACPCHFAEVVRRHGLSYTIAKRMPGDREGLSYRCYPMFDSILFPPVSTQRRWSRPYRNTCTLPAVRRTAPFRPCRQALCIEGTTRCWLRR